MSNTRTDQDYERRVKKRHNQFYTCHPSSRISQNYNEHNTNLDSNRFKKGWEELLDWHRKKGLYTVLKKSNSTLLWSRLILQVKSPFQMIKKNS